MCEGGGFLIEVGMNRLTWALSTVVAGAVLATGFVELRAPMAIAAPREGGQRQAQQPEEGVELRNYGTLLIRPVSIVAVIRESGRDDFGVTISYQIPATEEVRTIGLGDPAAAKLLWNDLAGLAARDPQGSGLVQAGDLVLLRPGHLVAARAVSNADGSGAIAGFELDLGGGAAQLRGDDQQYSRDQIRAAWEALAGLATKVRAAQ